MKKGITLAVALAASVSLINVVPAQNQSGSTPNNTGNQSGSSPGQSGNQSGNTGQNSGNRKKGDQTSSSSDQSNRDQQGNAASGSGQSGSRTDSAAGQDATGGGQSGGAGSGQSGQGGASGQSGSRSGQSGSSQSQGDKTTGSAGALNYIKFGLWNDAAARWKVENGAPPLDLHTVMRPKEEHVLSDLHFSLPKESGLDLSGRWLVVEIQEDSLDAPPLPEGVKGYSFVHSCEDIFITRGEDVADYKKPCKKS